MDFWLQKHGKIDLKSILNGFLAPKAWKN